MVQTDPVVAGWLHSLAVLERGECWAWGNNASGQLGDGSTTNKSRPVKVEIPGKVVAVAAGWQHSLALLETGECWACGHNAYGQLGDGSTTNTSRPVKVEIPGKVVAVAAGNQHSLAVLETGECWAWGSSELGQLGDGSTIKPVKAQIPSKVSRYAAQLRATVVAASAGSELDCLRLGALTKLAHEMGIGQQSMYDALDTDFPRDAVMDIIFQFNMAAELDPMKEVPKKSHSPTEIYCYLELAAKDSDQNFATFFFLHRSTLLSLPEGQMPVFQDLTKEGKLRAFKFDAGLAVNGQLKKKFVVVSHRWMKRYHPDPQGYQLAEVKKHAEECVAEWFWIDYACLPQNVQNESGEVTCQRTSTEDKYFGHSLKHVNLLYLGGSVLILFDRDYSGRFWCLLEAYLGMRLASASGLVSSVKEPHHVMICMGTTGDNSDRWKDILESDVSRNMEDMLNFLASDDVAVTNQADKKMMIGKMSSFEALVSSIFSKP